MPQHGDLEIYPSDTLRYSWIKNADKIDKLLTLLAKDACYNVHHGNIEND